MTNQNPAVPSNEATPGSVPQNGQQPSAPSSAPTQNGNQGNQNEGVVTIPLKEYRNLQRQDARAKSFDKRMGLKKPNASQSADPEGSDDPALVEKFNQAETARQEAERRALQAEVRGQVRDLLEKDEFKALPRSTKDLILKNPHMLTEAETLEEAMLDIEDFVREQVISLDANPSGGGQPPAQQPKGHEAPPVINSGAPAPANAAGLEDTSKLRGPQKSQATIRNLIKQAKGVKQV